MKILGIYRERAFSPGKIGADAAILDAVLQILSGRGHEASAAAAETIDRPVRAVDLVLSMAQSKRALGALASSGIPVINAVSAVRGCYRKPLIEKLSRNSVPIPAGRLESVCSLAAPDAFSRLHGCWLKRGDLHALGEEDVARIVSTDALSRTLAHFRGHGIDPVLVQEHVEGVCVKFYGVGVDSDGFFAAFRSDSGEAIPPGGRLPEIARAAAGCIGLEVYGGDAILIPDGTWNLIDLNDWPSFSRCRQPAAEAIAAYLERSSPIRGA